MSLFWGPNSVLSDECAADNAAQLWPPGEQPRPGDIGGDNVTGIILRDRTTGDSYRVYVDEGVLSVEAV